jgi:hypothetical protein
MPKLPFRRRLRRPRRLQTSQRLLPLLRLVLLVVLLILSLLGPLLQILLHLFLVRSEKCVFNPNRNCQLKLFCRSIARPCYFHRHSYYEQAINLSGPSNLLSDGKGKEFQKVDGG